MQTRMKGYRRDLDLSDLPLDLVPEVPMALWLFTEIERSSPELIVGWREQGYRVTSIAYDLTSKPAKHDPVRAFRETRLRLSLEAGGGQDDGPLLELTADLSFRRKAPERTLERLEVVPANRSVAGSGGRQSRLTLAAEAPTPSLVLEHPVEGLDHAGHPSVVEGLRRVGRAVVVGISHHRGVGYQHAGKAELPEPQVVRPVDAGNERRSAKGVDR